MKQKLNTFTLIIGLVAGLMSALIVAASPDVAMASDPCSTDVIRAGWSGTRDVCRKAIADSQDPCDAVRTHLMNHSDFDQVKITNQDVSSTVQACRAADPCSTLVIPPNWGPTRTACRDAVAASTNPCYAIKTHLGEGSNQAEVNQYKAIVDGCDDVYVSSVVHDPHAGDSETGSSGTGGAPYDPGPVDSGGGTQSEPDNSINELNPIDDSKKCKVAIKVLESIACSDSDSFGTSGHDPIVRILVFIINILTGGVAVVAIGGIAYGGILYASAESNPEQTKKAISVITNVVIGLIAYSLMFVILNFLIPGGVI